MFQLVKSSGDSDNFYLIDKSAPADSDNLFVLTAEDLAKLRKDIDDLIGDQK